MTLQDRIVTMKKPYGSKFQPSLRDLMHLRSAPNAEALGYCRPVLPGRDARTCIQLDTTTRRCHEGPCRSRYNVVTLLSGTGLLTEQQMNWCIQGVVG